MAGEGITANSPRRNLAILDERANDQRNRIDAIHQRFFNMRMKQQADINAFNKRIAQAGSQATLASVFQREQLMNKRMADIEAARAAYQQHYEQYGSALNESALKFLDQHAKIDVPTFTSIMAGYEHAKASAEQRDKERIDAQVAMAEKMGTLQAEQAKLVDERAQALIKPMIQDLENQKAMAAAQIEENKAYRDRLLGLEKDIFNAETRLLTTGTRGSGSGGAFSGAASAFNKANKSDPRPEWAKKFAETYVGTYDPEKYSGTEFVSFSDGSENTQTPYNSRYARVKNKEGREVIAANLLTDYKNGSALAQLEKSNPALYERLMKVEDEYVNDRKESGTKTQFYIGKNEGFNELSSKGDYTNVIPENVSRAAFRQMLDALVLNGEDGDIGKIARGEIKFVGQGSKTDENKNSTPVAMLTEIEKHLKNNIKGLTEDKENKVISQEDIDSNLPNSAVIAALRNVNASAVAGRNKLESFSDLWFETDMDKFRKRVEAEYPNYYFNEISVAGINKGIEDNRVRWQKMSEDAESMRQGFTPRNLYDDWEERDAQLRGESVQPQGNTSGQQVISNAISSAISRTNSDPSIADTMMRMAAAESAYKTDVRNAAGSSALGAFQITDSTWDTLRQKYPDFNLTKDGRTNPEQAAIGTALLIKEHQDAYARNGIEATPGNIYLGHFLGTGGALSFLNAYNTNPNQSAAAVIRNTKGLGEEAVKKNTGVLFDNGREKTVAEVKNWADRKMGGIGQQPAVQQRKSDAPWL